MSTLPTAVADTFSFKQSTNGPTTYQGSVAGNDILSSDSTMFGWTAVGAVRPGVWASFDQNGVLSFVEIVQSGYVTFPRVDYSTVIRTEMGGTVIMNTDGSFSYTAPHGYVGPDSFDYEIIDGQYEYHQATVQLNVEAEVGANQKPVAIDDEYTLVAGQKYTSSVSVLANDYDGPDGITTDDGLSIQGTTFLTKNGGIVSLYSTGQFTYTPKAGFTGVDTFDYTVRDGYIYEGWDASIRATDTGTVTLNVVPLPPPPNKGPVANTDAYAAKPNVPISGNVLDNDTDPEGDALSVDAATIVTANGGLVELNADGTFTYTPAAGFSDTDSFAYTVKDGHGGVSTCFVTLTYANAGPVAVDDAYSRKHDSVITGNVLANDSDPDGDQLGVVAQTLTTERGGVVVLNEDGTFTYTPDGGFVGLDSIEYTVEDGFGGASTGLVAITVTNAGPTAINDIYALAYGKGTSGNVLANDSDPDGDTLSTVAGTLKSASGGTVIIDDKGNFTYTPSSGHYGSDSFQYTVIDGFGGSAIAILQVTTAAPGNLSSGSAGDDKLYGTAGDDLIKSMGGDDYVYGGAGNDMIHGGEGKDALYGEAGDDTLSGDAGKDTLIGGDGKDTLDGGLNGDTMTGGLGADRFVLGTSAAGEYDRITDFKAEDQLVVRATQFGLGVGSLLDTSYLAKPAAADVDHGRFVYNAGSKSLFWDGDGSASTADVLVTTFSNKVTLTLSDFEVI